MTSMKGLTRDEIIDFEQKLLSEWASKLDDSLVVSISEDTPYFPDIEVVLSSDTDGNAGAIMGKVTRALWKRHVPTILRDQYRASSVAGSYDELVQTAMRWVTVG